MRLITGGIMHETHTFSAEPTPEPVWEIARGDACWSYAGTNCSLGGTIDGARAHHPNVELVPTFYANALASGPVDRVTFERFLAELTGEIQAALPADGVVLNLHGAMVAEGVADGEVEILRRVREVTGPVMPIAVTLDLHANTSRELVDLATIIVGYDTYPHVDINERAQEAVGLLVKTIAGEIVPTMGFSAPPLMPVPQAMNTSVHPYKTIFETIFALEERRDALSITFAGGFAYADTPAAGTSVIVITNNDLPAAQRMADRIARQAWDLRHEMVISNVSVEEAVAQAIAYPEGPVVLVDVGDNIGGGTTGDGTVILSELLRQGARNAVVVIADHEAVQEALRAGIGATIDLTVGGKVDSLHGDPVTISGTVRLLSDGRWTHEGPENAGVPVGNGPIAVIDVAGNSVVLTTMKTAPGDLQELKSVGIDPGRQHILVVKAAIRWRGGYLPITKHHIDVDTPGLGSVNLAKFDFHEIRRPIFPLDLDATWGDAEESGA
ncbi:MAG: M81 family metallopeptidase [Thermomicrobiales bacterium]